MSEGKRKQHPTDLDGNGDAPVAAAGDAAGAAPPDLAPTAGAMVGGGILIKRARVEDGDGLDEEGQGQGQRMVISSGPGGGKGKALVRQVKRTSGLKAPIISLTGAHQAEVLDVKFSPDGQMVAAAGADRVISLWNTYGENENVGMLAGHSKAVTGLFWSRLAPRTEPRLFSCSADGTVIAWDVLKGAKLRRLRGHKSIVNMVSATRAGRELLVSGSDDGRVLLWDWHQRDPIDAINVGYPVTAVEFSEDGNQLFVGGLDNDIHVYDLTRKGIIYTLRGHRDTILSLSLSPSGSHLLSTSQDSTVRVWDVRPFAPIADDDDDDAQGMNGEDGAAAQAHRRDARESSARLHRQLMGAPASFENVLLRAAWSPEGDRVACGGGDRTCTVWDVEKSKILYKLPGHRGTCTAVDLHPYEPIVVSASTDTTMLMGEIEPVA